MTTRSLTLVFLALSLSVFAQENSDQKYGKNLIVMSPMHLYGSDYINDISLGLSYERMLDKDLSIQVPFAFGLVENLLQTGVGVKFYPTGNEGVVKYAIAPTFLFSTSNDRWDYYSYDEFGSYYHESNRRDFQLGFMLSNSLNITLNENFYLGMEGGFGVNYVTWSKSNGSSRTYDGPDVNGILKANIGVRF